MNHDFSLDTNGSCLQLYGLVTNHEQFFDIITNHGLNFEAIMYHDSRVLSPIMDHDKTLYHPACIKHIKGSDL